MAENKLQMSLGDLCASLVNEFAVSLALVKRSHPWVVVRSVKLRLGQEQVAEDDTVNNGSSPPAPLILTERYPDSDKGWQLELDLGERRTDVKETPISLPQQLTATALDLVADNPVTDVDGINSKWGDFFSGHGITRIIDLARLNDSGLQEIMAASKSLKLREFRQKVLLLKVPLTALPSSSLDDTSLDQLLRLSQSELQQAFGIKRVSKTEVETLMELLDLLNLALDNRILKKINLGQLIVH